MSKEEAEAVAGGGGEKEQEESAAPKKKNHNKYRKPKPWDHDGIDHWKIQVRHATSLMRSQKHLPVTHPPPPTRASNRIGSQSS